MTSAPRAQSLESRFFQNSLVRRVDRWLHAMPQPSTVLEISPDHVAMAHWGNVRGHLESVAVELLPAGAVMPSPVDTNVTQPDAVRAAMRRAFGRVPVGNAPVALLIPDAVVRVFLLPFEDLPRRTDEALPLLRWRLKKSVPFDVDEASVSWMRQNGRDGTLEIAVAIARQRIVREYEEIVESLGAQAGVVVSSTLASLPLLDDNGSTLLVRLSGRSLTTVVVRGGNLCVYRSTDMPAEAALLEPQAMLDEVFPAAAYYQDTWDAPIDRARFSGFGDRDELFRDALTTELKITVEPMADTVGTYKHEAAVKDLISHGLDPLAGWMMNGEG